MEEDGGWLTEYLIYKHCRGKLKTFVSFFRAPPRLPQFRPMPMRAGEYLRSGDINILGLKLN